MVFEWDENKNRINKIKHGVDFETASYVFQDQFMVSRLERVVDGEERWQTIGISKGTLMVIVAHTYCEDNEIIIRIISARKPVPSERKRYEKGTF